MRFIISWIKNLFSKPVAQVAVTTKYEWKEEWTEWLNKTLAPNLEYFCFFHSAQDIKKLHPNFELLSYVQKRDLFVAFIKELCLYESGWNPKSESVDVGVKTDKNTWSVGLMQISVIDQSNLGIRLGYTYEDLKDPIKNLHLGLMILLNQIKKRGKIFIPKGEKGNPGVYWAVIHPGGKYDKTEAILAKTRVIPFRLPGDDVKPVDPEMRRTHKIMRDELVELWMKDVGEKETHGKNRSPLIDSICKFFGLPPGQPYCIGGLLYRTHQYLESKGLKNPLPKTMSTQSFYNSAPGKYKKIKGIKASKADICIQRKRSDHNLGHAYALTEDEGVEQFTVEYNTDLNGGRDGDGVATHIRSQLGDLSKEYRGAVDIVQWIMDHNGLTND